MDCEWIARTRIGKPRPPFPAASLPVALLLHKATKHSSCRFFSSDHSHGIAVGSQTCGRGRFRRGPLPTAAYTAAIGGIEPPVGENPLGGIDHPPGVINFLVHCNLGIVRVTNCKNRDIANSSAGNPVPTRGCRWTLLVIACARCGRAAALMENFRYAPSPIWLGRPSGRWPYAVRVLDF
jgi:hypothetical protein